MATTRIILIFDAIKTITWYAVTTFINSKKCGFNHGLLHVARSLKYKRTPEKIHLTITLTITDWVSN